MTERRAPSPPITPPPRWTAQDYTFGEPSPSKLFAVDEEETSETIERFNKLLLEEQQEDSQLDMRSPRPVTPQSSGDSLPSTLLQPSHYSRPRNRSPYSRPHLRSQSSSSSLSAPPMMRAHSSPAFSPTQSAFLPTARSSSPLRSPKRARSPFSWSNEESQFHGSAISDIGSIDEDHELDITPRASEHRTSPFLSSADASPSFQLFSNSTFPIRKRRPASPLHQVALAGSNLGPHSPNLSALKFNESFPNELTYTRSYSSASSMPSTPTSVRSRSPSISSLETIPDTPDAEAEAIAAEKLDRLRRASEGGAESFRRPSLDSGRPGFGNRDKRKRWSVCGAEKRSDLNLETIWED